MSEFIVVEDRILTNFDFMQFHVSRTLWTGTGLVNSDNLFRTYAPVNWGFIESTKDSSHVRCQTITLINGVIVMHRKMPVHHRSLSLLKTRLALHHRCQSRQSINCCPQTLIIHRESYGRGTPYGNQYCFLWTFYVFLVAMFFVNFICNNKAKNILKSTYHIVSYHIVSYRIVSCPILSYRIASHRIASHRIASHRNLIFA